MTSYVSIMYFCPEHTSAPPIIYIYSRGFVSLSHDKCNGYGTVHPRAASSDYDHVERPRIQRVLGAQGSGEGGTR